MPATSSLFLRLQGAMRTYQIRNSDLARELKCTPRTITHRFAGTRPWTLEEMYATMDLIHADHDQLHIYFPPGGKE